MRGTLYSKSYPCPSPLPPRAHGTKRVGRDLQDVAWNLWAPGACRGLWQGLVASWSLADPPACSVLSRPLGPPLARVVPGNHRTAPPPPPPPPPAVAPALSPSVQGRPGLLCLHVLDSTCSRSSRCAGGAAAATRAPTRSLGRRGSRPAPVLGLGLGLGPGFGLGLGLGLGLG